MKRTDPDVYEVSGPPSLPAPPEDVIAALAPLVTPDRLARIEAVAAARTLDVVPVLEKIHDPHNASAVLRTADAFGIQRVDVIPAEHGFVAARGVAKGTHHWLDVVRHVSSSGAVQSLHEDGYRVFVAAMGAERTPESLREEPRVAVVFGNEHRGVSDEMRELADGTFAVPMVGFVESLNVSVAAAVTLHVLRRDRSGSLDDGTRSILVARYLMTTVRDAARVVRDRTSRT
jgi:tRNA (guanosine-2'-O-)-methyltransferase